MAWLLCDCVQSNHSRFDRLQADHFIYMSLICSCPMPITSHYISCSLETDQLCLSSAACDLQRWESWCNYIPSGIHVYIVEYTSIIHILSACVHWLVSKKLHSLHSTSSWGQGLISLLLCILMYRKKVNHKPTQPPKGRQDCNTWKYLKWQTTHIIKEFFFYRMFYIKYAYFHLQRHMIGCIELIYIYLKSSHYMNYVQDDYHNTILWPTSKIINKWIW